MGRADQPRHNNSVSRSDYDPLHILVWRAPPVVTVVVGSDAENIADGRDWPAQGDWEFGPDALRDPWLYDDGADEDVDVLVAEDDERPGADMLGR